MALTTILAICFSLVLYRVYSSPTHPTPPPDTPPSAYILTNKVTHIRHLPVSSKHAFTYPTISLLLSLDALETGALDLPHTLLRGTLFSYGGLFFRLTGIRPDGYLMRTKAKMSIRQKLERLLSERGVLHDHNNTPQLELAGIWMLTMPSFLGWEGINPLTVYFCYDTTGQFRLCVLEIHNTFGESHVHILEAGVNEDDVSPPPPPLSTHQWTIPRQFHVSPFNDRQGWYRINVDVPQGPPMPPIRASTITIQESANPISCSKLKDRGDTPPIPNPTPTIHIHLLSSHLKLKLTALLTPHTSLPLTSPTLLIALYTYPAVLWLTMVRIIWEAWGLWVRRGLGVWVRPAMRGVGAGVGRGGGVGVRRGREGEEEEEAFDRTEDSPTPARLAGYKDGGIRWIQDGWMERYARWRVERFLAQMARMEWEGARDGVRSGEGMEGKEGEGQKVEEVLVRLVPGDVYEDVREFRVRVPTRSSPSLTPSLLSSSSSSSSSVLSMDSKVSSTPFTHPQPATPSKTQLPTKTPTKTKPTKTKTKTLTLTITHLSPQFFTLLLRAPNARCAYLMGGGLGLGLGFERWRGDEGGGDEGAARGGEDVGEGREGDEDEKEHERGRDEGAKEHDRVFEVSDSRLFEDVFSPLCSRGECGDREKETETGMGMGMGMGMVQRFRWWALSERVRGREDESGLGRSGRCASLKQRQTRTSRHSHSHSHSHSHRHTHFLDPAPALALDPPNPNPTAPHLKETETLKNSTICVLDFVLIALLVGLDAVEKWVFWGVGVGVEG